MPSPKKVTVNDWEDVEKLKHTGQIEIPADPLDRVLGQEEAISLAKIAAIQRRNLLLVGPPGTGKSMIARAISMNLPKATQEIRVSHNPENPERPFLNVIEAAEVKSEEGDEKDSVGTLVDPEDIPKSVAERLGYLCRGCGHISSPEEVNCPSCGRSKLDGQGTGGNNPFGVNIMGILQSTGLSPQMTAGKERVNTIRVQNGVEETVVFERAGMKVRMLDTKALEKRNKLNKKSTSKTLVKLDRNPFVMATGASETELLGDVRHDPYGGHDKIGVPAYQRVIPGAIHEAHEGVLFVDEISHLGSLQRYILTAMQDKKFPITGRNPQSSGASVKVENVPCDFILVAACNMQDLENILSPLRSRIIGNGYEVLVDIAMPDNSHNRAKYAQFVAQEIAMDGHVPHAAIDAVEEIISEGKRRARLDGQMNALTLRLRELGGLIRAAGDLAVMEKSKYITADHVRRAKKRSEPVEEQIKQRYGSYQKGMTHDISDAQKQKSEYYLQNEHIDDSMYQ
ncbi:ATP-dependent protease [methanogenic archaeon ISO4-H5]|nr:ATP-dependent protease [methanogenic archaeon ISO4-H5]